MVVSRLESGTYTIANKRYSNAAYLRTDDEGEPLKAKSSDGSDYYKWIITRLDDGCFTVKNLQTMLFAYVSADMDDDYVIVEARAQSQRWTIVGTGMTDVFRIVSTELSGRYWGLSASSGGTPIELREGPGDPNNQWIIKSTTPATSVAALPSGRYFIVNAQHANATTSTYGQPLHVAANDHSDMFRWSVQRLSNGGYTIQNIASQLFAYVGATPGYGTLVTSNNGSKEWRIMQTIIPGRYIIAAPDMDLFWGLAYGTAGTPVTLRVPSTDTTNQWDISVIFQESATETPFDTPFDINIPLNTPPDTPDTELLSECQPSPHTPYLGEGNNHYHTMPDTDTSTMTPPLEMLQRMADQDMDVPLDAAPSTGWGDDGASNDRADISWKCGQCSVIFELSYLAKIHFLLTHATLPLPSSAVPPSPLSSIERSIQIVDRTPRRCVYKDTLGIIAQQLWSKLASTHARKASLASECYTALLKFVQGDAEHAAESEDVEYLVRVSCSRSEILDLGYRLDLGGDPGFEKAISQEEEHILQLFAAYSESDSTAILTLRDTPAVNVLNLLDIILHPTTTVFPDRSYFRASLASQSSVLERSMRRTFVRLSEASLQTPSRLYISGVRLTDRQAFKFGSYGAIYKGEYGEHVVALKSLFKQLDPKQNKVYCREVAILRGLSHSNVCPLIGIDSQSLYPNICIVMPWMAYGTVVEYMHFCGWSEADATRLICEISSALAYLHQEDIVHGDLHEKNVLVDGTGSVRLTDFGLANFADAGPSAGTIMAGAPRYMAPEIIDPNPVQSAESQDNRSTTSIRHTPASDMFSFGQVAWHIYTEKEPYAGLSTYQACVQISLKQHPQQSPSERRIPDSLWQIMEACWAYEPSSRPTAASVHSQLEVIIRDATSPRGDPAVIEAPANLKEPGSDNLGNQESENLGENTEDQSAIAQQDIPESPFKNSSEPTAEDTLQLSETEVAGGSDLGTQTAIYAKEVPGFGDGHNPDTGSISAINAAGNQTYQQPASPHISEPSPPRPQPVGAFLRDDPNTPKEIEPDQVNACRCCVIM